MPTGNVSIRLSIQDAETVRAALEKLGTDGAAALKKIETASSQPSGGLNALDKGVASAKTRLEELGTSLGPVGALLMGLGPIGIAAAAGLGGALLVMHEMSKEANELADRAQGIRSFAEATGLTTAQVQALTAEGAKFNVSNEQLSAGMQHLAVNLDQAHRAQGSLYEDLQRVNPKLADQVAAAKDVASAYDLIGRAIAQANAAGNTSEAAAVARAAFGRNFGGQGALAADVAGQGGPNSLAATYTAAGRALDDGLLKRLTELARQNAQLEQQTKDIWASMFSEDVLERANRLDLALLSMAQSAKEFHDATKDESWGASIIRLLAKTSSENGDSSVSDQIDQDVLQNSARRRLAAGLQSGQRSNLDQVWQPAGRGGDQSSKIPNPDPDGNLYTAQEHLKQLVATLGGAATPAEQFYGKLLQLATALKSHSVVAIDAEKEEKKLEAQLEKTAATSQVAARALEYLRDSRTVETESARERLGLASQEEILTARLIELKRQEAEAGIKPGSPEDQAAQERVRRTAEQTFRQEQINNSPYKGLAAMANPDLNSSLDQLGTTTLNSLDKTVVSLAMDTERGSVAWRQFGLSAVQAIEQMIVKMTLLKLASAGLEALFGGAGGLLGAGVGGGKGGSSFALGGIMTSMGPLALNRYAGGGVATGPQLALFGEGRGPEAYVPLPDGRAIPSVVDFRNVRGGGGGHTFNNSFNMHVTVPQGTSAEGAHQMAAAFGRQARDMITQTVHETIITQLRTGGLLNPA